MRGNESTHATFPSPSVTFNHRSCAGRHAIQMQRAPVMKGEGGRGKSRNPDREQVQTKRQMGRKGQRWGKRREERGRRSGCKSSRPTYPPTSTYPILSLPIKEGVGIGTAARDGVDTYKQTKP